PLNHLVGAYSVATAEIPVHRIIRYCRNRQALGLLNDYSDRLQDSTYGQGSLGGVADQVETQIGDEAAAAPAPAPAAEPETPALDGVEMVNRVREDFGELAPEGTNKKGGRIAQAIQEWMVEVKGQIQVHVDDVLEERSIGDGHWGLREVALWEHHSEIVDPFHQDMDPVQSDTVPERFPFARPAPGGGSGVVYNHRWLNKQFKKFHVAARFLVRKHMTKHFEGVEQKAGRYTRDWLQTVRDEVDRLLNARPSGWKDARVYLDVVLSELGDRVKTAQADVGNKKFKPVSTKDCYDQAAGAVRSLQDEVDKKPIAQRALRAGQVLGIAGGLILGAIVTIVAKWVPGLSPWSPGGVGWLVFPAVVSVLALAWLHIRRLAQVRCDAINDIVLPKNQDPEAGAISAHGGSLNRIYDDQTRRLFDVKNVDSFLGARVEWSCRLWTLRIWRRMYLALKQDLERLGDIGIALDVQTSNVRDDQEGLKVRFHEENHRFLEEVRGVFEGDSFFCQNLVTPDVLEEIYERFSRPAQRYAQEHLNSESPFAQWRDQTPFTDLDAVQNHCRGPFAELEDLDFFNFPPTQDQVRGRLRDFLGDFTHKLALHADAGDGVGGEVGQDEQLVLTSQRNRWLVDELGPDDGWPDSWEVDSRYPDAHAITLIRHVQGLAPWELPSLGSPAELVRSMVTVGDHAEIPNVIRTVEDVSLRLVMAGVALGELCGVPEEKRELDLCREVLAAASLSESGRSGQNPVDGQKFVDLGAARTWVKALEGEDGVLELASLLFGTSILEEHADLENLIARKSLLMAAGQDQVDWVWRGLMVLPESWRHPVMMRLVEAEMVPHLLAQRRADEALSCLDALQPESLRASALMRAAGTLVQKGNFVHAREALQLARIPLDDDFPPMPSEYDAWPGGNGQPAL
ncbi:MAG: hypothetical protein VX938_08280, partial [Myxococcota bacterium]|nr:hypothetical protein [Myxococcota bacterium]